MKRVGAVDLMYERLRDMETENRRLQGENQELRSRLRTGADALAQCYCGAHFPECTPLPYADYRAVMNRLTKQEPAAGKETDLR